MLSPTVPRPVLEERWRRMAELQARHQLDALVCCGRGKIAQYGFVCYATGFVLFSVPAYAVAFPDGMPALLVNERERDFARQLDLGDFIPATSAARASPGEQLLDLLRARVPTRGRVGIAGLGAIMPIQDHERLTSGLPEVQLIEVSKSMAQMKAVKTDEDLRLIEATYAIADRAFARLAEIVRPGRTEWEVAAQLEYLVRREGALQAYVMVQSGTMYPRYPTGRVIGTDEIVACVIELVGPTGYWVEKGGMVAIGQPAAEHLALASTAQRALEAGAASLVPGRSISETVSAVRAAIGDDLRLGPLVGHGVGVDHDLPDLTPGHDAVLREGMVIALHPHVLHGNRSMGAKFCEQFVLERQGARRLSRLEVGIIEVPSGDAGINVVPLPIASRT